LVHGIPISPKEREAVGLLKKSQPRNLTHKVILRAEADNVIPRVNILLTGFLHLVKDVDSFKVIKADITGDGCIEILVGCNRNAVVVGDLSPSKLSVQVEALTEGDDRHAEIRLGDVAKLHG
jgi:hypothetical protein